MWVADFVVKYFIDYYYKICAKHRWLLLFLLEEITRKESILIIDNI